MFNKKLYKVCSILFIFIIFLGTFSVYAGPTPITGGSPVNEVVDVAKNVWATAEKVIQILAVAAVVFAGLRYMFASADGRADIKRQTVILVVGAVLVFGAVETAGLIYNAAKDII